MPRPLTPLSTVAVPVATSTARASRAVPAREDVSVGAVPAPREDDRASLVGMKVRNDGRAGPRRERPETSSASRTSSSRRPAGERHRDELMSVQAADRRAAGPSKKLNATCLVSGENAGSPIFVANSFKPGDGITAPVFMSYSFVSPVFDVDPSR